jgi:PAS domain S-box-containing protein
MSHGLPEFASSDIDVGAEPPKGASLLTAQALGRVAEFELLNALPIAIYVTDAEGRITYFNEAAATLWDYRPRLHSDQWCGAWRLFWPDGSPLPHDKCPMAIALKERRAVRGCEAVAERPDGTRVPFLPFPTPLFDASGTLIGAINMLIDLTEQKAAERATRRLVSIVESSDDAIVSKDLNGVIATWNRGAERLFGYFAEEVIGKPIMIIVPSDRQAEEAGTSKSRCSPGKRTIGPKICWRWRRRPST